MGRHSPVVSAGRCVRPLVDNIPLTKVTIHCTMMQVQVDSEPDHEEPQAILHVVVIGFHHKKGSQVDYCYPPLPLPAAADGSPSDSSETDELPLPAAWKSLPTLALPDGAHNFVSDTVFFHLPMLGKGGGTKMSASQEQTELQVYCISCYKQVVASDSLKESDSSITRSTIMKAVVVMSRLPYYGLIAAKTESMTRVYFKQHDFKDKSCLIELHSNLNYVLSKSQREILSPTEASLLSLSPSRYLISLFGHRVIVLLKLLLLEKKVLFFLNLSSNPVPALSNTVTQYQSFSEAAAAAGGGGGSEGVDSLMTVKNLCLVVLTLASLIPTNFHSYTKDYHLYCNHCQSGTEKEEDDEKNASAIIETIPRLEPFRQGNEIHPYLCLSHIDKITNYTSCMVGATNALFKQKKSALFDVFVDCQTGKIEFEDSEMKKILTPSTEDLRFADFLCKHAITCNPSLDPRSPGKEVSTDSFDGGDDWLRIQFNLYLLHALRTSFLRDDSKEVSSFNSSFMRYWKEKTENYKYWKENFLNSILDKESDADEVEVIIRKSFRNIKPGHPFLNARSPNVSNVMSDMKLRFLSSYGPSLFTAQSSSSLSSSPTASKNHSTPATSDRKQGVIDAGRSAISSAKSTFTSWINSYPTNPTEAEADETREGCQGTSAHRDFDPQLRFSSLLRQQEEDKDEIVYDRKHFVP